MPSRADLLQAKQTLSASLLRASLRGETIGMMAAMRVERAIATARGNIHAIGIGRKIVDGDVTQDLCVRVHVVQKIAESLLPPIYRVPKLINGIPTDVIESPPAYLLGRKSPTRKTTSNKATTANAPACTTNRRQSQRPLVAGVSAGHFNITAGTIGYFCQSTRNGDDPTHIYVLSNNHVFADVNQGHADDELYQPSPLDGGTAADHFANLTRWVPIQTGGTTPNRVDAAIGRLRTGVAHQAELCSIGSITGIEQAVEGMQVRKHGRTTGYTEGEVTDESYDARVSMDESDPNIVALFENQMRIERIAPYSAIGLGGDSGSLIVRKEEPIAVGLYFAGPQSGVYGVANHIQDVLNELEIRFL